MLLADMGADVIKVEKIPGGDDTRRSVPPTIAGESAAYLMMSARCESVLGIGCASSKSHWAEI
jgi:crotonobetainyl-CoA:carnitine CoA-transferase CaiB-like acyl-CoA transferase